MKMATLRLYVLLLFTGTFFATATGSQDTVNYLASSLTVRYTVLDNLQSNVSFSGEIVIENTGGENITDLTWSLYLCSFRVFQHEDLRPDGADLGDTGLRVYHVNGYIYKIEPSVTFPGFVAGQRLVVPFQARDHQISVAETLPNWYFVAPKAEPRVLTSVSGERMDWVGDFSTPEQWKRSPADTYDPYTAGDRFDLYDALDLGGAPSPVIPTPVNVSLDGTSGAVDVGSGDWVVVVGDARLEKEAWFLADSLGIAAVGSEVRPPNRAIRLTIDGVVDEEGEVVNKSEAYRLDVSPTEEMVSIVGTDPAGVLYGAQTLLSLHALSSRIPGGYVVDYPRYAYRGFQLDVARNFRSKSTVLKYLDFMATYKMNRFHFHVTDDEGWRLEIPGIPELTEIGSRRCHDPTGDVCLMPHLGSPPGLTNPGTGHYTVTDYRDILRYAADRHIRVVPEFDMPGHAYAAVHSMLARYRAHIATNKTAATEYLLTDLEDDSSYISVQRFYNNSVNPCVGSTYQFVRHLVKEVKKMHEDIQPLEVFNFGGDEVPGGAWANSPACRESAADSEAIKENFVRQIAEIAHAEGLDLAGWEDGFMANGKFPYNVSSMPNDNKFAYAWNNVVERGTAENAYLLANAGYKTILSLATHLYFGHPYEPDPLDRGFYWATRVVPNRKVFGLMPDSLYDNFDVDGNGVPVDKEVVCEVHGCVPLAPGRKENIIGLEGHVWGENIRTDGQTEDVTFPRLLVLAEKAWHKPSWESESEPGRREEARRVDWERFANTLGHRELARLDGMGIGYRVNPPGARISESGVLEARAEFPGLPLRYSTDGGVTWADYKPGVVMPSGSVRVVTRSADSRRASREVTLEVSEPTVSRASSFIRTSVRLSSVMWICAIRLLVFP